MTVAMSAVVAAVALVSVAVAGLGQMYAARAQAQTAADAAALAAAAATYPPASSLRPVAAAELAARENRAAVLTCSCTQDGTLVPRIVEVVVGVRVDVPVFGDWLVRGSARAEFDPLRYLGGHQVGGNG